MAIWLSISDPIRLGVVGLGRAFILTLPSFKADDRVRLVAAAEPCPIARTTFAEEFGAATYDTVPALAADADVEAVYVASPHGLHAEHAEQLAAAGKHLLVEKPLAVTLDSARRIVAAAEAVGVHLITGPSHSFDAPVLAARKMIEGGELGRVRMIQAFNYTDFLYRPRRPDELSTAEGGGVIFSQAIHQIDIVRLLSGTRAKSVTARTGAWDRDRPTEGAYAAVLDFEDGVFASLTYSGYAHFDSDIWQDGIGELGYPKDPGAYGKTRRTLASATTEEDETRLKSARTFGTAKALPPAPFSEHFGPVVVCCDRGDLRITPKGCWVYGPAERGFQHLPVLPAPRSPVIAALYQAVRQNQPPRQAGRWGVASLEICHAMIRSAETGAAVALRHQA